MSKNRKLDSSYYAAGIALLAALFFLTSNATYGYFSQTALAASAPAAVAVPIATSTPMPIRVVHTALPEVEHLAQPAEVKGIYMSQCVVGTPSFRKKLVQFVEDTELNAIVIDIRDYTGKISFPTKNPELKNMVSDACGASDMRTFIKSLHEKGIFVIGRITTFQNPYYTKLHPDEAVQKRCSPSTTLGANAAGTCGVWTDFKGLAFVDVGAKPYWDSVVALGTEAFTQMGFDELNFDYVRFPSDGPMAEAVYSWEKPLDGARGRRPSKQEALEEFFAYLSSHLRDVHSGEYSPVLSADLFGMSATNYDDLSIGQVLERAFPYFDRIYPMVYPSHYPSGFHGYTKVNEHAYDIVHVAMSAAGKRAEATTTLIAAMPYEKILIPPTSTSSATTTAFKKPIYDRSKVAPWLQSFNYPVEYTPRMVSDQIQAAHDAGIDTYLFWDAGNKYVALRKVLAKNTATTSEATTSRQ